MQDMKLQDMNFLKYILVVLLCYYISVQLFEHCTNCFDELFVCEGAFFVKDNDSGNFHDNLADANYTEEKH